jgi:hypothetical protein
MTDNRRDVPIERVDATGQPLDGEVLPSEQPPMDDAAGGPDADRAPRIEETSTEDLSVQGGA